MLMKCMDWLHGKTRGCLGVTLGWFLLCVLFYAVGDKMLGAYPLFAFVSREVLLWGCFILWVACILLFIPFAVMRGRGVFFAGLGNCVSVLMVSAIASYLLCDMPLPMVREPSEEWVKANISSRIEVSYGDLAFIGGNGRRSFPSALYEIKNPSPKCLEGIDLAKWRDNAEEVFGTLFKDNGVSLSRHHNLVLLRRDFRAGQDIWAVVDQERTFLYVCQSSVGVFKGLLAVFEPTY